MFLHVSIILSTVGCMMSLPVWSGIYLCRGREGVWSQRGVWSLLGGGYYKARHAHKRLYTVLPKYSKIQVLPDIDTMQTGHTNENKQFWPKYKIMTITKIWKYSIFTKKPANSCI